MIHPVSGTGILTHNLLVMRVKYLFEPMSEVGRMYGKIKSKIL